MHGCPSLAYCVAKRPPADPLASIRDPKFSTFTSPPSCLHRTAPAASVQARPRRARAQLSHINCVTTRPKHPCGAGLFLDRARYVSAFRPLQTACPHSAHIAGAAFPDHYRSNNSSSTKRRRRGPLRAETANPTSRSVSRRGRDLRSISWTMERRARGPTEIGDDRPPRLDPIIPRSRRSCRTPANCLNRLDGRRQPCSPFDAPPPHPPQHRQQARRSRRRSRLAPLGLCLAGGVKEGA